MKGKGFTVLELLLVLSMALSMLAIVLPSYMRNLRMRAVQSAARFLEVAIAERKQRAFSLGTNTGLCVGKDNAVFVYDDPPFAAGTPAMRKLADFKSAFGRPVAVSVQSIGAAPGSNPCGAGDAVIQLSPLPDGSRDWQGTIKLSSGLQEWSMTGTGGGLADAP